MYKEAVYYNIDAQILKDIISSYKGVHIKEYEEIFDCKTYTVCELIIEDIKWPRGLNDLWRELYASPIFNKEVNWMTLEKLCDKYPNIESIETETVESKYNHKISINLKIQNNVITIVGDTLTDTLNKADRRLEFLEEEYQWEILN